MKICKKCSVEKELTEFGKNKRRKGGLELICKNCHNIYRAIYYKNNKEKIKEKSKKYRENNKEKIKEYKKEYRLNNKEEIKKRKQRWISKNEDKIKEYKKKYRLNNKEKTKEWIENNKEKIKEYKKEYRLNNKEKIKEKIKEYRLNNKDKIKEHKKEYYAKNKDSIRDKEKIRYKNNNEKIKAYQKEYYAKNKEKVNKRNKEWALNNRDKTNANSLRYFHEVIKKDPLLKLKSLLRCRTYKAFKVSRWDKNSSNIEMLGCSYEIAKKHIERQFEKGMTWDNQGEWHIDHEYPLSSANTEEELIKLCHYRNLKPLWAKDNLEKGATIPNVQIQFKI